MRSRPHAVPGFWLAMLLVMGGGAVTIRAGSDRSWRYDAAEDGAAVGLWPDMRVDVNTATAGELTLLPAIGPSLAAEIVADRDLHGHFAGLHDLTRVKGVGERTVERLVDWAVIDADPGHFDPE